ncbi:MAG: Hpt domain-containing protein [Bdellovibrionota bacterium]
MTFVLTIPDEMRQKYIGRRVQDLESLKAALAKSEFDLFFKVGHQLRGNAATFGYESLGILGEKLEHAGTARDSAEAEECLSVLEKWISEQKSQPK